MSHNSSASIPVSEFFYSNIDKIKMEAVWNDDVQRWKVPDLVVEKTKLPPAGKYSNSTVR
jgi:hypothetical protein